MRTIECWREKERALAAVSVVDTCRRSPTEQFGTEVVEICDSNTGEAVSSKVVSRGGNTSKVAVNEILTGESTSGKLDAIEAIEREKATYG